MLHNSAISLGIDIDPVHRAGVLTVDTHAEPHSGAFSRGSHDEVHVARVEPVWSPDPEPEPEFQVKLHKVEPVRLSASRAARMWAGAMDEWGSSREPPRAGSVALATRPRAWTVSSGD